ncbi:hypothetical protein GUJ93_ZPchr0015g6752 [Zizania palustris]|uniref:Uncharacterized protein n=1 Tax=Zizania palustris TaxID=103762 RepID=A0A8J5TAZ2_ZIZPA|nr:hypothetical protein GUJ93_ZPchr0015g6752 [Zizania palustris]
MADGANPNPPTARPRQKHVPDWLNSPIWSTPPPPACHLSPPRVTSPPTSPPPQPPRDDPASPPLPPPPARSDVASSDDGSNGDQGAASSLRPHLVAEFTVALGRKVVDLAELRRLACQGVPNGAGVRPIVWKINA